MFPAVVTGKKKTWLIQKVIHGRLMTEWTAISAREGGVYALTGFHRQSKIVQKVQVT